MYTKKHIVKFIIGLFNLCLLFFACTFLCPYVSQAASGSIQVSGTVPLSQEFINLIKTESVISASPYVALIGQTIFVTVQIIGANNTGLVNHTVKVGIIGVNGVTLQQLTTQTDSTGIVRAMVTSTVPGSFQLYAIDQTYAQSDNVEILLDSSPFIQFTANPIQKVILNLSPTPTPVQTIIPTTSPTLTPTITPTISPTLFPTVFQTPTPTSLIPEKNTGFNLFDVIRAILSYRWSNNTIIGIIFMILLFFVYYFIYRKSHSRTQMYEYILIYSIILLITYFLMIVLDIPYIIVIPLWTFLTLEFVKVLWQRHINQANRDMIS